MAPVPAAWIAAFVLGLTHLAAFADRYLIALVAPSLKTDLRLSDFEIGLLQGTAFVIVYVIGTLLAGPLVERRRRVPIIAASIAAWSLATAASGLVGSFAGMFLARIALGLGQAALSPAALSLIAGLMPPGQISRGVSVYTTGSTLGRSAALLGGGALLPVLIGFGPLASFAGGQAWRALFVVAVLPNLLLIAAVLALREPPLPRQARRTAWSGWLVRHRAVYALHIAAAGAATLMIQAVTAWTTTLLVRRGGFSVAEAGAVFGSIVLVAGPVGHLTGGYLLDRLRRRFRARTPHVVLAMSFLASAPGAAFFCLADAPTLGLTGLAALSVALGLATPAGFAGIQTMTPRPMRARASALFLCCNTLIGFGLGPPVVGLLTDEVFGERGIHLSLLVTLAAAAAVGLGACAIRFARPR